MSGCFCGLFVVMALIAFVFGLFVLDCVVLFGG